jgi:hypothetical protein
MIIAGYIDPISIDRSLASRRPFLVGLLTWEVAFVVSYLSSVMDI